MAKVVPTMDEAVAKIKFGQGALARVTSTAGEAVAKVTGTVDKTLTTAAFAVDVTLTMASSALNVTLATAYLRRRSRYAHSASAVGLHGHNLGPVATAAATNLAAATMILATAGAYLSGRSGKLCRRDDDFCSHLGRRDGRRPGSWP